MGSFLRLLKRLRSAFGLSPADVRQTIEAAVLFHGFRLMLRVVPFRRFQRVLGAPGPPAEFPTDPPGPAPPVAVAVSRALFRASKGYPDTCLPQSLAARVMLRRRGVPSTLSLGTRREGDDFAFHAWIATSGVVLNVGGGSRPFVTLATYYDPPPVGAPARPV